MRKSLLTLTIFYIIFLATLLLTASCEEISVSPGTATLTSAVDAATAGDTLILDPGVFTVAATTYYGLYILPPNLKIYGA